MLDAEFLSERNWVSISGVFMCVACRVCFIFGFSLVFHRAFRVCQLKENYLSELGGKRGDYITCHHGEELFQARASDGYVPCFFYLWVGGSLLETYLGLHVCFDEDSQN
jgi:hypothetical protein